MKHKRHTTDQIIAKLRQADGYTPFFVPHKELGIANVTGSHHKIIITWLNNQK